MRRLVTVSVLALVGLSFLFASSVNVFSQEDGNPPAKAEAKTKKEKKPKKEEAKDEKPKEEPKSEADKPKGTSEDEEAKKKADEEAKKKAEEEAKKKAEDEKPKETSEELGKLTSQELAARLKLAKTPKAISGILAVRFSTLPAFPTWFQYHEEVYPGFKSIDYAPGLDGFKAVAHIGAARAVGIPDGYEIHRGQLTSFRGHANGTLVMTTQNPASGFALVKKSGIGVESPINVLFRPFKNGTLGDAIEVTGQDDGSGNALIYGAPDAENGTFFVTKK